ncbi:leukotriene B4 receptor 1-like [Hoplias malabaricus]|uniref:leukotriene B4 receptor 1-like n=1 Tax=Hoplias malabaricus TaxID=27720 RepID=UPI0034619787
MQQVNCSNTSLFAQVFPVKTAGSAVLGLCFVLGVPANLTVLGILIQQWKENNFTLKLMMSLAVSDLLNLLPIPMWIWANLHGWNFVSTSCKIISYVDYWCFYCSLLCVTLMSVQRFLQVLHPQKLSKLGTKGENGLLSGIWILSGVLSSYIPLEYDVGFEQYGLQDCYKIFRDDTDKVVVSFVEILVFFICFFLLVFLYYCLHRGVNETSFNSSSRTTKLVARICVLFFILGVLVVITDILNIIAKFLKNQSLSTTTTYLVTIVETLELLNSCVNPFLYTFSHGGLHRCSSVLEHR